MNRNKAFFSFLLVATALLLLPARPASTKAGRPSTAPAGGPPPATESPFLTTLAAPAQFVAAAPAPQHQSSDSDSSSTPSAAGTNYSLSLNGTGAYVRVVDSPSLDVSGPITVEAWIKTNTISQQAIIERYRWLDAPDGGFALRLNGEGKLQFYTIQSNTQNDSLTGTTALSVGVWHHVAGVFDGSQLRVYVDGALDGSKESTVSPGAGTADLKIGAEGASDAHFFNGLIDEARVTSGVRYAADFVPDRDLTLGGLVAGDGDTGPSGIWNFSNQEAQDFSGKNNHGTLVGGAGFSAETAQSEVEIFGEEIGPPRGGPITLEMDDPGGPPMASAVAPIVINFDNVANGTFINSNYHPDAVFSTAPGLAIVAWNRNGLACSSCPNVITRINPNTNTFDHFADLLVTFPKPVDNLRFVIMGVDSSGTFARVDVRHQGGRLLSQNVVAGSGNPSQPVVVNIGSVGLKLVTSVRVYMDNTIFDDKGISFDDFSFDLSPPPAAPTGVRAEMTNLQITVRWNGVPDAESYTVKRAPAAGGPYTTLGTTNGTNFIDGNPLLGTTSFYVVTATTLAGTSANSTPASILAAIPSPSDLTAVPDMESVLLNWAPAAAGVSYRIRRRSTTDDWQVIAQDVLTTAFRDETAIPDAHYFYTVAAYVGSAESEQSNVADAILLPSCSMPVFPKPSSQHIAIPGSSWEMDAVVSDRDGLVLENIKLNGRYHARMISVPYYIIKTNKMPTPQRGELTPVSGEGVLRAHLVHYSVQPYFKSNSGGPIDHIAVTAMYDVDHITPTSKSCLFIEQSYEFHEPIPGDTCEPSGAFTCVRYFPFVKYSFIGRQGEKLESINFAQRHHYKPDNYDDYTIGIFRDCESPGALCLREHVPGEHGNIVFSKLRNPLPAEFESDVVRGGRDIKQWDNFHQTYNDRVSEPLENLRHFMAGCPECAHIHWRWTSATGLYVTRPFGATPAGVPILNGNFFSQVMNKKQDVAIAAVRYRPGEEHPSATQTYKSYVNNEPLRRVQAIPPPNPTVGGVINVSRPDGDMVFWYSATGYEQKDEFFRHGGFFNPAFFKQNRPVGTPPSAQGGASAALSSEENVPLSVTFGRLFKEGSITSTRIVPSTVAPLPAGYTPLESAAFKITTDAIVAGPHDVTFKVASVTDQATFDKLRVFYAEPDPFDPGQAIWVDRTILSPDTPAPDFANRTISARSVYLGRFMIAQLTQPQPAPSQANLSVNATDSADPVIAGNDLTYNLTVTNNGPSPTTGAGLVDHLSPDVEFISVSSSTGVCEFHEGVVYCKLGTLAPGASATVAITVVPIEGADRFPAAGRFIDNTAFVGSYNTDTDLGNNRAVVTTKALPNPNGPPTVTITSPATGSRHVGPVNLSVTASASDSDGTVSKVELYDNGELTATGTAQGGGQYSFLLNNLAFGVHLLSAVVTDNGGRSDSSEPVHLLVNGPAQVSILSPSEAAVLAPNSGLTLTARATVPTGTVNKVEFFANGTLLGTGTPGAAGQYSFTWNSAPRGKYVLTAVATDSAGVESFSVPVSFTVTQAPTVSLTSPTDGAVFQSGVKLTLTAQAQDGDGTIEKVEFYANGELLGTDEAQVGSQYRLIWAPQDGIYSVSVVVTDDLGVSTNSTPITIGVNTPSLSPGDFIWFDEAIPRGARAFGGRDDWHWVTSNPAAILGTKSHQSLIQDGFHQHGFDSASFKLPVNAGDKLYTYVFLHPGYIPQEIMLEWRDGSGWDHRAFWSAQNVSLIRARTTGDESSHWMGPIPTDSHWIRLEVPAEAVGLAGKVVDGMAFDLYGGRAAFDRAGKTSQPTPQPPAAQDTVWFEENLPGTVRFGNEKDKWEFVQPPVPFSNLAHKTFQAPSNDADAATLYRAHWFTDSSQTMTVNNGDILFTYAYVPHEFAPDQLVVGWGDNNGFRYAYWGDSRRVIGNLGTETMRYMGPLPDVDKWVRLEVPASYLGLDGKTVNAMYFGMNRQLRRGLVYWDRAGKSTLPLSTNIELLHATTPVYRFSNEFGYSYFVHPYWFAGLQPGPRWYAHNNQAPGTVPFYRYRFPNSPRQYFYTDLPPDSQGRLPSDVNWKLDTEFGSNGIAFYIYPKDKPQPPGTVPLLRYTNNSGRYFYTSYPEEQPPNLFGNRVEVGYVSQTLPVFSPMENPIDNAVFFVRQHYRDFFSREADIGGLNFWVGEINQCNDPAKRGPNETISACAERKRVDVSGAFFLSIEFKETGYLVYRLYNAALVRDSGLLGFDEFLADSAKIGDGVIVNAEGWQAKLEANKVAFINEFVERDEFLSLYPEAMTPDQYVVALYAHAGITLSPEERQAAVAEFLSQSSSSDRPARARVLRKLAESEALNDRELNRAFVLMQYFGYLRRHPAAPPDSDLNGFNFWLDKLNQFDGDWRAAEMVKAFITAIEYRARFGQPVTATASSKITAGSSSVKAGAVSVTFASAGSSGTLDVKSVYPTYLASAPEGYAFYDNLGWNVSTTPSVSGTLTIKVSLDGYINDSAEFANLRLLHLEGGVWVDRTILPADFNNRTISASVNSLAPVAVARLIGDRPPTVSITSPTTGQGYTAPAAVTINATASSNTASVTMVEFLQGETVLGEDTTAPYSFAWSNVPAGNYALTARATDSRGVSSTSPAVNVSVNDLPAVFIASPAQNAVFDYPANLNLAAYANDSNGVKQVEFFQGTTSLGVDTTAPYGVTFNNPPVGTYTLTAKATDNLNAVMTSPPVTVVVRNLPPSVSLTSPADGAQLGNAPVTVTVSANASDSNGVQQVEFFRNGVSLGVDTTTPYSITWSNAAAGSYSLTARATDNLGASTTSSPVNVTLGNAAPTVSITSPASGTYYNAPASVVIAAAAADNEGIKKVEFFQGTTKLGEDTTAPYGFTWSNVPAGSYSLTARATDNLDAVMISAAVNVTVGGALFTLFSDDFNDNVMDTAKWYVTDPLSASLVAERNQRLELTPATSASVTAYNGYASAPFIDMTNAQVTVEVPQYAPSFGHETYFQLANNTGNTLLFVAGGGGLILQDSATGSAGRTVITSYNTTQHRFWRFRHDQATDRILWETSSDGAVWITLRSVARPFAITSMAVQLFSGKYPGVAAPAETAVFDNLKVESTVANTQPTVSITSPANGAVLTAPASATITASASDSDGSITRVEFLSGSTSLGVDTTAPYSVTINNAVAGSYSLTARATDNRGGITTSAPVTIIVNASPSVFVTMPANGSTYTSPATVTLGASASDSDGTISSVEFFRNGVSLGVDTTTPYSITWSNVAAGTYSLTAKATDNRGAATTSSPVTITVSAPNTGPTVSITAPANGSVYMAPAAITLNATASDSDGTVTNVEFFRNGQSLGVDTTAPYSFDWTNVPAGSYSFTARATDNSGATTISFAVSVTVNPQPTPARADTVGVYVTNSFRLRNSNSPGTADITTTYGTAGWTPVVGDWDGNGTTTLGVFNPTNGQGQSVFYLSNRTDSSTADNTITFGLTGDKPVAGDWDGNGTVTIGVYRESEYTFYLRNTNTAGPADIVVSFYPTYYGETPVAGDWDGDGVDTIGMHRSSNATFSLRNTNTSGPLDVTVGFGSIGAIPVVGDWDGDGKTTVGSFSGSNATFSLRNTNTTGPADLTFQYGVVGNSIPIAGNWDGPRAVGCGDTVWFDDTLPAGAVTTGYNEVWANITNNPVPFSGRWAHPSPAAAGEHGHFFNGATQTLPVAAGEKLFAYVYLDAVNTPAEVMLQWNNGSWEHRAYWGANTITWGVDGSNSRRYMGPLPPAGQWVRLEVPASLVGLEGATVNGMSFNLAGGGAAWDRAGKTTAASASVLISEFRFRGTGGASDEFVELYNNSDAPVTVCATDGSGGWALVASDGLTRFTVPNGTVIPARGHYLATGSAYGLGAYAAGDKSYTAEIADNAGIALFNTRNPFGFFTSNRLDAVGFSTLTNPLYFEGSGLGPLSAAGGEYSFVRRFAGAYPQDTNNNAADFAFISNNGDFYGGSVASMLGGAGPENLLSPLLRNGPVGVVDLDPGVSTSISPNRTRYQCAETPDCNAASAPLGTLVVRKKIVNNTGVTLAGLRVRLMDFTTLNSSGYTNAAQADLRAISTADSNITLTDGSTILVKGATLEQPPSQPAGGGYNSTLKVPLPAGGLPPGGTVNVQFALGVQRSGTLRFFFITEALP